MIFIDLMAAGWCANLLAKKNKGKDYWHRHQLISNSNNSCKNCATRCK
jgi:hypothetical protein